MRAHIDMFNKPADIVKMLPRESRYAKIRTALMRFYPLGPSVESVCVFPACTPASDGGKSPVLRWKNKM